MAETLDGFTCRQVISIIKTLENDQNYYTIAFILLVKIDMCGKFGYLRVLVYLVIYDSG